MALAPTTWPLSPSDALAARVKVHAARPNGASMAGRRGFKIVMTLEPASTEHVRFAYPMKKGRPGALYRFISGGAVTGTGRDCAAWLDSSGVTGMWAMEGDALYPADEWRVLNAPIRLSVFYACDDTVGDGEMVEFDFGLYLIDPAGRAAMATWSARDVPVRAQVLRSAG